MKFGEVIDALKNGLPIRRKDWDEDTYTYYDFDKYVFVDIFVNGETIESKDAPFGLADLAADDWEIHEWDTEEDEVRPPTQFAKEIIEDYKQAVQNGEIIKEEEKCLNID
jgi:hypothetical protein